MKLAIGQVLYYVPHDLRRSTGPREVRVETIGRKWAGLRHAEPASPGSAVFLHFGRCDFAGNVDGRGYTSPGRCWPSKAGYEEHVVLWTAWRSLARTIENDYRHSMPPGVTVETINAATKLLGLTPSEGTP